MVYQYLGLGLPSAEANRSLQVESVANKSFPRNSSEVSVRIFSTCDGLFKARILKVVNGTQGGNFSYEMIWAYRGLKDDVYLSSTLEGNEDLANIEKLSIQIAPKNVSEKYSLYYKVEQKGGALRFSGQYAALVRNCPPFWHFKALGQEPVDRG